MSGPLPEPVGSCPHCRGIGWVLDASGNGQLPPVSLELLPCLLPECEVSGQAIEVLSLGGMASAPPFVSVVPHPVTGEPMSLQGRT